MYKIVRDVIFFSEISLSKEDHIKVLNKLGSYMESLMTQEVPSFVYQLLKFCKNQNFLSIVIILQQYFGLRLYKETNDYTDASIDEGKKIGYLFDNC